MKFNADIWENNITKILPLHKSDSYTPKDKLDYGDLILFEQLISCARAAVP